MARILIKPDCSFEAVARVPERKSNNQKLHGMEIELRAARSALKTAQLIAKKKVALEAARLAAKSGASKNPAAAAAKRDSLKTEIAILLKSIVGTVKSVPRLEARVKTMQDKIAASKKTPALKSEQARIQSNLPKGRRDSVAPTSAPRKASFDVGAKRAATQAAREIKGELARLGKEALAPSKKPAAGVTKHAAPANSAIQGVLKVINQLKRDIAGGLTGTKLAHAKAELAKQRSSLRTLRKGQSAKNQAAVTKTPATKNMGKAKPKAAATTPVDLKALRATMTELHKKVMAEKDATKKAALEKRYKAAVAKFKKMRLVK